ncbi:unnamed protein product [Paramecium sonneborni]|uniref:G domain-containing protein n=1 Tax=Paramecium sonneborni TaxID=65129 RepID=A0A8S1Q8H7_9CILI|nr:unnamed protein product [Paramecium sonneborni]
MSYTLLNGEKVKERILQKLNYKGDEDRKKQLDLYLDELNKLGFYIELLPQIEPKFFVEKQGFSIKEALILTRGEKQVRPTDEEINQLKYDEETNILKLEFQNIPFENQNKKQYILILGPPNRGKTTFIFNIINNIFNVQYNSMYRVKKKAQEQKEYFDEYHIQISGKNYVFVDFRGIGDLKLDFLGLDQTGHTNLYVQILVYIKDKLKENSTIAAIFYINSSSINRLSEDESYCLQRFFEMIPKTIIQNNKFFLILTYCTDNQPKMTIYEKSSSTPQDLKNLISTKNLAQELKFWYGINNKPLYEPIILQEEQQDLQQQQKENQNDSLSKELQELIKNIEINDNGCLNPQGDANDGHELVENQDDQQNQIAENKQQVELGEGQLQKFQYNLMTNVIKEIIQKVDKLSHQNDNQKILKFFENQLKYENDILDLLKIYQSKKSPEQIQKEEMKQFTTTYLVYEFKQLQEKEIIITKKGSKVLMCNVCHLKCHLNCYMRSAEDRVRICRKFNENLECTKCQKNQKEGNKVKKCGPSDHILLGLGQEIFKKTQITLINYVNYSNIKNYLPLNKKSKALNRLKQTAAIKAQLSYQDQIQKIKVNISSSIQSNESEENCINIDLNKRAKYLDAMMIQLENNNQNGDGFYQKLQEQIEIYKNFEKQKNNHNNNGLNVLETQLINLQSQPLNQQQPQQQSPKQQQPQQQSPQQQQPQNLSLGNSSISQQQNSYMSFRQQQSFLQNNEFNNNRQQQNDEPQQQQLQNSAMFNILNDQQPLITQN